MRTPDGHRLLYEEYLRFGAIADSSRRQWLALLPAFGGALLILALAQLPLAWLLARRLQRREQEREGLSVRLVEASDRERRRLAQALHEGPVQELAGLTWRLSAAARRTNGALAGELEANAAAARQAQHDLRTLLVTLHPPNLRRVGLQAALSDVAAPQRHAEATRVEVRLRRDDATAHLRVHDDGHGFTPEELAGRQANGHRGLALLRDLAADGGGRLTLHAAPGAGTSLELDLPVA